MAVSLPEIRIPTIEKAVRDEVKDLLTCPSTVGRLPSLVPSREAIAERVAI